MNNKRTSPSHFLLAVTKPASLLLLAHFLFANLLFTHSAFAQFFLIDPQHSQISFRVQHLGIGWVSGKFEEFGGTLEFYPQDFTKSRVDASIRTSSIDTGSAKRDKHLKSEDFFDTMSNRAITFLSNKIEGASVENFKLTGALTIRGVTKEVTLDVRYGGAVIDPWGTPRAAFNATTKINRKDFGLTWNRLLDSGAFMVGEEIDISIDIQGAAPTKSAPRMSDPSLDKAKPGS